MGAWTIYWALVEKLCGQQEAARLSYHRAIGLTEDPAIRADLREQVAQF
jgi:predicted RNA polymerase sigma factor